jgi:hypothetical protein
VSIVVRLVAGGWLSPESGAEWALALREIGPLDYAMAVTFGVVLAYVGLA